MSRDIKIWLVIMAIYLGLVGGMVWTSSQVEHPLEGQVVNLPFVTNSVTIPVDLPIVSVDILFGGLSK